MNQDLPHDAVAVVGIGCRLPGGADTPDRYWRLLRDGVDAITELPADRFDVDDVYDPDPAAPGKIYSRWGGFVENVDRFDADFFGIAPREAKRMDPQHRLLLEVVWEALEDGGQRPGDLAGTSTGVFVGISTHDYSDLHLTPAQRPLLDGHVSIGNALCAAPNRLSHLLDLHGPSMAIDTACSSSLTAVHLARRSMASGESDMAIVAGVNLILSEGLTIGFCKASMIAPDGRCSAFGADATGYVRSEGAGAVVLKPVTRALEDGDPIHAIIRGSAVNQDGRTVGISLPNADAQERLMRQALRDAGLDPTQVHYIEAHGTGTAAGDPAEADAIGRVFGRGRENGDAIVVGSSKSNLGHLEAGAGIAGLIKAALMLRHREVPPSLHAEELNPNIPFDAYRVRVPTSLEPWPAADGPAIAGVSASGFGGANAHVVLQQAPAPPPAPRDRLPHDHVLVVSARRDEALRSLTASYRDLLREGDAPAPYDVCATAAVRRTHHEYRLAAVGSTAEELASSLDAFLAGEPSPDLASARASSGDPPKLTFVFSGMGPQWWAMGRELLRDEPVFRSTLEACDRELRPVSGWSLLDELTKDEQASRLGETRIVQVVSCAFQIALAALWRHWGVVPDAVVGHSAGEMAAAHVAGALSMGDALRIAYHRGRLLHRSTGTGTMLAAAVGEREAEALLDGRADRVAVAAVNSPSAVTFSGDRATLEEIARLLEEQERFCRFLPTEVPYHAPQVETVRDELLAALADVEPRPLEIPMVSEVTGTWVGDEPLDGSYWWRNIRQPVLFGACVDTLIADGHHLFCEIGPHPALAGYLTECLAERSRSGSVVASLRRHEDERRAMLRALAALHVRGRSVDWASVLPNGASVPLPTYPWQRERYWLDPSPADAAGAVGTDTHRPSLGRRVPAAHPIWQTDLADARLDFLDAHVVEASTIFPGAGYVEMAVAAARELGHEGPVVLETTAFRKLLFPGERRARALQLLHHPPDGSLEIHSAERGDAGWTLHATATLRDAVGDGSRPIVDLAALRERCHRPVAVSGYYEMLEGYGFHYGSAFRGLQQAWEGEDEALARVGFPAGAELPVDRFEVHPALLDSAFQLLAAAGGLSPRADDRSGGPLFPRSIRRITHHRPPGASFWVHAAVERSDDAVIDGDVTIFDDHGDVALVCHGLHLEVLEEADASGDAHDAIDSWLYQLRWEEAPHERSSAGAGSSTVRPPNRIVADLAEDSGPEDDADLAAYHAAVAPVLDRIAAGYARLALDALGLDAARSDGTPTDRLADVLGVVPRHHRLFRELVRQDDARREVAGDRASPAPSRAELRADLDALAAERPAFAAEVALLRMGGEALAEILGGGVDAREILLADEALEQLERMYVRSPTCGPYHALLADTVRAAVGSSPAGAPPRVLEVGGGTGAATASILPALPEASSYVFTDISPRFVSLAGDRFGAWPGFEARALDVERDPRDQGFAPGSFDLVVAANVLHATADLRATLGHLRDLMAPGALIAVLELAQRRTWYDLVFGLLDGWWRFTDTDLRPSYPLLDLDGWRRVLDGCGFEQATTLASGGDGEPLQSVVIGRRPVSVPAHEPAHEPAVASSAEHASDLESVPASASAAVPATEPATGPALATPGALQPTATGRHWLIFADDGEVGADLAAELRARGDACTCVRHGPAFLRTSDDAFELPADDGAAYERLLADLRGAGRAPDGTAHLWSLDAPSDEHASTRDVMEAQRLGSESVLLLAQALERSGDGTSTLSLVTSASQPVDGHDAAPHVAQAPLWGLGRVLMNARPAARCRLIDLGPDGTPEQVAALADELVFGDSHDHAEEIADEEVALRAGRRFVRRLQRSPLGPPQDRDAADTASPDRDTFRLDIDEPGSLESLALRAFPHRDPGPGEIAIRIVASGLNFRDVLLGLGTLPEETPVNEDGGVPLGMECSGVVLACGEGVEAFRPGDEVVAVAWGTLGSRVVTSARLAVAKPPSTTFAEAASITNAFVTAEYALRHFADLQPGERVLIHSATGAVGLAAIQVCRRVGAEVFATAGSDEKRAYLRSLGIEHVMDSRTLAFRDDVRERTGGEGVDVVLNSLAGEAMRASLGLLRPYGRFVELGKRDIHEDAQIGLQPFARNLAYTALDLIQLSLDRPERIQRLMLDAVRQIETGEYAPVPCTTFDLGEAEQAFRLMAQARHVGKIVLTVQEPAYEVRSQREPGLCRADATYLITGGLGGLGLAVAEWLGRQGARNLVLASRSGEPKDGADALDALRASGVRVEIARTDVADEDAVADVLDRIGREMPPLAGVVHAAMVLDDDLIDRLDQERFRAVMAPKVAGAWNLHRATEDLPLEFFVLFSSAASILGQPMQGNYAAANAFLDSLAAHRIARGLPALTVGWGALADVGYVARHPEVAKYVSRGGLDSFTPAQACDALEALLRRDLPHVVAARIDWAKVMATSPLLASSRRFTDLAPAAGPTETPSPAGDGAPLALLRAAAPEARRDAVQQYVVGRVARVLGGTPERVDPDRPLTEIGFDSLMAVELTTVVNADLDVQLRVVKILEGSSSADIATMLVETLFGDEETPAPEEPAPTDTGTHAPSEPDAGHPLSFEQHRLWFLHRLDPGNPAYNIPIAVGLQGDLDVDALRRSLHAAVERHDLLRATFREAEGTPVQAIDPHVDVALRVVGLEHLPASERETEMQRLATSTIREPFDLGRGPPLRACLFRLADNDHALVLVVHHIVCDAWSMNWLAREIATLYGAFAAGRPASLPPSPASYLDYVRREREGLDENVVDAQLAYWREQLDGAEAGLRMPGRPPRRGGPPERGAHAPFELSAAATAALEAWSREEGVTLFMTLLAAFQTLLHRHSGQEDLCVGTPVATRGPDDEAVVGCFMNTLVLRGDLSGEPTFRELLQRTRKVTLEALAHQDVPFERVVDAVRPQRDAGGSPLFEAMLVLHNARLPEFRVAGLDLRPVEVESGTAVSDLVLLLDVGERLHGVLEYDADRFDRATMDRLLERFRTLLEGIVADPDRPIDALPLTGLPERHETLHGPNATETDLGEPTCLHRLVEERIERSPHAVALAFADEEVTFAELGRRSEALAGRLRGIGIGPGDVVAVCLPRSPTAVAAALGATMAGGAYLPLDPSHPPARLRYVLDDARAGALVTVDDVLDALGRVEVPLVTPGDDGGWTSSAEPTARRGRAPTPDDAAYLVYTSGSTGEPKGVMVPHRAIVNQVRWRQQAFPLGQDDAVLHRTPVGFDPAIWELFGPLAAGARTVLPTADEENDPAALVRLLGEQRVTVLQAVPSVLSALLEQPGIDRCRTLRTVFCGGERLTAELQQRFFERLSASLHNLYGPSETTIDATFWTCRPGAGPDDAPIGRPIANARVYLLDGRLQPVPLGVPGEIYIAGAGVADGYRGRPELTAERFLPDRFAERPGARMYRSGDRGRRLEDGAIAFLGRVDRQLKVRGVRVEPEEIERLLAEHPSVREAAVVATDHGTERGSLVAFVVRERPRRTDADLRVFLAERLPAPMVPATIQELDDLPRNASGKIDRRRLAAEAERAPVRERPVAAPRDNVELRLQRIWEEEFPGRSVGVTDDFFELGGHSLMAASVLARVERAFGAELPLATLLQGRTIRRLAERLHDRPGSDSPIVALQPHGDRSPFFLVHPAGGSVYSYVELARALGDERPVYGLQGRGLEPGEEPDDRIDEMAARYVDALVEMRPEGPLLIGGWSLGGLVAYDMARMLVARGRHVPVLALLDASPPRANRALDRTGMLRAFAEHAGLPVRAVEAAMRDPADRDADDRLAPLLEEAHELGTVGPDIRAEALGRQVNVFRAHLDAVDRYVPARYPGRLELFEASERPAGASERERGWERLAEGGVARHAVPGGHYEMVRPPHVTVLAERLQRSLEKAEAIAS